MARRTFRVQLARNGIQLLEDLLRLQGGTRASVIERALIDYASQIGLGCAASASQEGASYSNVQVSCGLACPNCASPCVLPVRYGVLNQRLSDALRAGACVYGGRVLSDNSPELACTVCGARFDAPDGDTRK